MTAKFIDLSHYFEDDMPGFTLKNEDGSFILYTAKIKSFLAHEQTLPKYLGKCIKFQTSVGIYLDSPCHRYPSKRDISQLNIDEVVLPGIVIDVRGRGAMEAVPLEFIPKNIRLKCKAVLFNFGWGKHWGTEQYYS